VTVRLRYAPSPTGDPHVGNIRTALWTWLHARRHGGQFVLRLEDTDQGRAIPGSLERIEGSLRWLGIDWDEGPDCGGPFGPYVQSQRLTLYRDAADRLLASGHAYRCFCTADDLEALRERQRTEKLPTGYDGRCRTIDPAEAAARAGAGGAHVVRFAMPGDGSTTFTDLLRAEITVENAQLDDFVILKSDGFPTYHLASVVDDHAMEITHVTRGEEWIPSTPRHIRLYDALGYTPPIFCHTPVILGPDGGKLSKRHGAKSVLEYAEDGYLPEALFNFLAITGWALDDHTEIFSREQLMEAFDIGDLSHHPAVFDTNKLEWMNGVYLRSLPEELIAERFASQLDRDLPSEVARPVSRDLVRQLTPLVRERVKLLPEVTDMTGFFFLASAPQPDLDDLLGKRYRERATDAATIIEAVAGDLAPQDDWRAEPIEACLRACAERSREKPGDVFMLCRVAITGKPITPPLFETMAIVGREACIERLQAAAARLRAERSEPVPSEQ